MAKLYIKFNTAVIKEVELVKEETTFGRKSTNDIVIDHPTISGSHCKIKKEGDRFIVEDLKSTNGTFLNGHRITAAALKDKDQIGLASHVLEFVEAVSADIPESKPVEKSTAPAAAAYSDAIPFPVRPGLIKEENGDGANHPPNSNEDSGNKNTPSSQPVSGDGVIKVVSGAVDGQNEVRLKDLVTYIGTSTQAAIKIKGLLAPSLAAAISRRPEGFFLKAVKSGYPKVNGNAVKEQVFLENGALIEVGGTNMVFYLSDAKKANN